MRGLLVSALLVAVLVVGAGIGYLGRVPERVTSTTTLTETLLTGPANPSEVCVSNMQNPPQAQYVAMLDQMIKFPNFVQYSDGRCWTWESTFEVSGPGYSKVNFVFDHFSDRVYYNCGYYPGYEADARVYAVPSLTNGTVTGVTLEVQTPPNGSFCVSISAGIRPVWLNLVSWDSSGQRVSVRLLFSPFSNDSLRELDARISNTTWTCDVHFADVNSTDPLQAGSSATQEVFVPGAQFRGDVFYNVRATGTYLNGTTLVSNFHMLLQT